MTEANGSPVTRAELAAHIKGIDQNFAAVKEDIGDVKADIGDIKDLLTVTSNQLIMRQGQSFGVGVSFKVIAAVVAGLGTTVTAVVVVTSFLVH